MKHWPLFALILALVGAAAWYDLNPNFPIKEGLDLKGGMRVVLEVDKSKLSRDIPLDTATAASIRQILAGPVAGYQVNDRSSTRPAAEQD